MRPISNHRFFQIAKLNDKASFNRVAYYCRSIKAANIGNSGAARYFNSKAQQWERIRIATQRLICNA